MVENGRGKGRGLRLLVAALAVQCVALVAIDGAAAKPHPVGINEGPGLNGSAGLTRLGPMYVVFRGGAPVDNRRWTLAFAARAFGERRTERGSPTECHVRWPRLGLTIYFRGHQADGRDGCRTPADLYVSEARIAGGAAKGRFATRRGVRIGTRAARLRKAYPGARRSGRRWVLMNSRMCFGTDCHTRASLIAVVRKGRVAELRAATHAD